MYCVGISTKQAFYKTNWYKKKMGVFLLMYCVGISNKLVLYLVDLIIIETFIGLIYEGKRVKAISKISKEPNFFIIESEYIIKQTNKPIKTPTKQSNKRKQLAWAIQNKQPQQNHKKRHHKQAQQKHKQNKHPTQKNRNNTTTSPGHLHQSSPISHRFAQHKKLTASTTYKTEIPK